MKMFNSPNTMHCHVVTMHRPMRKKRWKNKLELGFCIFTLFSLRALMQMLKFFIKMLDQLGKNGLRKLKKMPVFFFYMFVPSFLKFIKFCNVMERVRLGYYAVPIGKIVLVWR